MNKFKTFPLTSIYILIICMMIVISYITFILSYRDDKLSFLTHPVDSVELHKLCNRESIFEYEVNDSVQYNIYYTNKHKIKVGFFQNDTLIFVYDTLGEIELYKNRYFDEEMYHISKPGKKLCSSSDVNNIMDYIKR